MKLFEQKRLIQTEWDNSVESTINFHKAIAELKQENIPFRVVKKRVITEYAKRLYITYFRNVNNISFNRTPSTFR